MAQTLIHPGGLNTHAKFQRARDKVVITTVSARQTGKWGDQGDGTYRNPLIAGDYGAVFSDLVQVDSTFDASRMKRYNEGVFASTLRFHDGKFWVFVNFIGDGFWMANTTNPAGPWAIQQIKDKNGVPLRTHGWTDPCPFWDEDGRAYLASSHPGSK